MAIVHAVLYTASLGIVSHYVGQALPRRWFHPDRFPTAAFPGSRTVKSTAAWASTTGRIWSPI